jgi:hypothetical protein
MDDSTGRPFFVHTKTGVTQWNPPVAEDAATQQVRQGRAEVDAAPRTRRPTFMPEGWSSSFTDAGQKYYVHQASQNTQWERPPGNLNWEIRVALSSMLLVFLMMMLSLRRIPYIIITYNLFWKASSWCTYHREDYAASPFTKLKGPMSKIQNKSFMYANAYCNTHTHTAQHQHSTQQ